MNAAADSSKSVPGLKVTWKGKRDPRELVRGLEKFWGPALEDFTLYVDTDYGHRMTPEAVEDIVRNLPVGLKSLSLDGFFDIDLDDSLPADFLSNICKYIEKLSLLTNLTLSGIEVPLEVMRFPGGLASLTLNRIDVTGAMLENIAAKLPLLRELNVWFPPKHRRDCVKAIAKLKELERLGVPQCRITDNMFAHICSSLPKIKHLDISHNYLVTTEGFRRVCSLRNLEKLDMEGLELLVVTEEYGNMNNVLTHYKKDTPELVALRKRGVEVKHSPLEVILAPRSMTGHPWSESYSTE